jgi:AraC family transcriptional regulator
MDSFETRATAHGRGQRTGPEAAMLFPVCSAAAPSLSHDRDAGESGASRVALYWSSDGVRTRSLARLIATWPGLSGEVVSIVERERFESEYCGPLHLLIAYEGVIRQQGESVLDGVPRSTLRDLRQKLTFVPAGRVFREWQEPRAPGRVVYFYIEVGGPLVGPEVGCAPVELAPRLFFDSPALRETVLKLTSLIEAGPSACSVYAEALGVILAHELLGLDRGRAPAGPPARGGLDGWQRRIVKEYLEEHLAEPVTLAKLAELTQLSRCHLSRAFKQSFGMPPHQYHGSRRIERAKTLLAEPMRSVTDIAFEMGFGGPSSFAMAFRKFTGRTPTEFRRALV